MRKSEFLSVYLLKDQIKHLFDKCDKFVFQQANRDDDNSKKEITLICYGVKNDGRVIDTTPIQLAINSSGESAYGTKNVGFGNLPIGSTSLKDAFGSDEKLEFFPEQYKNYIRYRIPIKTLDDIILNPSPPA